jgi:glycosyltransferase involved in cell wall biosynthesis
MEAMERDRDGRAEEVLGLSVVVPLLNEEENAAELVDRISASLRRTGRTYEIICVDDGSTDRTADVLRAKRGEEPRLVVIRFRRNFGQTAALMAGFQEARGEIILTMDGDLQNDPDDIPVLLATLEDGHDIVSGWRKERKDTFINRRLPSIIANRLISSLTGVKLHDYGCSLKAFRRDVAKHLKLYGEMHRFIPAIASWMGVSVAEVVVRHHPRRAGKSKYGISRTVRVLLDLITIKFILDFSTKPIQIFGLIGLLSMTAGGGIALWLTYQKFFHHMALSNRPILLLAILLVFIGVQFITMGLLAEIQTRIYHETSDKSIYVVKEIIR